MNYNEYLLSTEQDTKNLAVKFAKIAKRGDVFALYGTLGMGKSVFSRAFIQELCKAEDVPSPTFTLLQTYEAPNFDIYHYDLYRLKHPDEVFELGIEDAFYNAVCLIEWPDKMGGYLPKDIFIIEILPFNNGRKIRVSASSAEKQTRLSLIGDFL